MKTAYQFFVQDSNGVSQPNATIEVRRDGDLVPIFSDKDGTPKTNPFNATDDAYALFYADSGTYSIKATFGAQSFEFVDVQIGAQTTSNVVQRYYLTEDTSSVSKSGAIFGASVYVDGDYLPPDNGNGVVNWAITNNELGVIEFTPAITASVGSPKTLTVYWYSETNDAVLDLQGGLITYYQGQFDAALADWDSDAATSLSTRETTWDNSLAQKEFEFDIAISGIDGVNIGEYSTNPTYTAYNQYATYERQVDPLPADPIVERWYLKASKPLGYAIDSATNPDPMDDTANLYPSDAVSREYVESVTSLTNLLSNHNFLIPSSLVVDATPQDVLAGVEIFSGVFAGASGIQGLTYINGRVSFSGGNFYFPVPNSGGLEHVTDFVASVADFDGKPRTRGVSFSLVGDEYRITVGVDALEDDSGNATPLGSVKFEQGGVATGHEVSIGEKSAITLSQAISQSACVGDIVIVSDRGFSPFKYETGLTANGFDIIEHHGSNLQLELQDKKNQLVEAFGVVQGVDSSAAFQRCAEIGVMNFSKNGSYVGNFTFSNDLFVWGNNSDITPAAAGGVISNDVENIALSVINLNAPLGTKFQSSSDRFIDVEGLTGFDAIKCRITDGGRHIYAKQCSKVNIKKNTSLNSNDWGIYLDGATDFEVSQNIAANCATHDGIKLGGNTLSSGETEKIAYLRGSVHHNICRGNFRDGIDAAVNGAEQVSIHDNICYDNLLNGIGFKILDLAGFQSDVKQLSIHNNIIEFITAGGTGIEIQNSDKANVDFEDSSIHDNVIRSGATQMDGVRLDNCNGLNVHDNDLYNFRRGVRVVNGATANRIYSNNIEAFNPFLVESQGDGNPDDNLFYGNDLNQLLEGASGNGNTAIVSDGDNNQFYDNKITKGQTDQYTLAAENLGNAATNTKWYNNILSYVDATPTGWRCVVGDVFINVDPSVLGSPDKWVCHTQTTSSDIFNLSGVGQRGYRTNAGDPNGTLTPQFIGEEVYDSSGLRFWKAKGGGSMNWV